MNVFWNRINVQCIVFVIMIVQSEFHIHDDLYIYTMRTLSIGLIISPGYWLFLKTINLGLDSFLQIMHFFTHRV